ncbi:MAG: phosphoribosyltransferase family protein [Actinomycetota bacterium]
MSGRRADQGSRARFSDRCAAGRELASRLEHLRAAQPVVLALPRGGVPVAVEIADALEAPLDVILVRKLGVPTQPEWAMGAIGEGGVVVLNEDVVAAAAVSGADLASVRTREVDELRRRTERYRHGTAPIPVHGRTVIVVDDGIATGATAEAAAEVIAVQRPARIVMAAPVAPPRVVARLQQRVDEVVVLHTPEPFEAVGIWYDDFRPITDAEVEEMIRAAR